MTTPSRPEEVEPKFEWTQKDGCDTLLVHLPGYKRENLKVQVTTSRNLRVLGERKIHDKKVYRFQKEFSLSNECDANGISAKFEGEVLQVRLPKTPGVAAAGVQNEEVKQGAAAKTTEDEQKPAEDESGRNKAIKDAEHKEEKTKGNVADAIEETKSHDKNGRKENDVKMRLKKTMKNRNTTFLAVIIVAVAVALGVGMLHSKEGIYKFLSGKWRVTENFP